MFACRKTFEILPDIAEHLPWTNTRCRAIPSHGGTCDRWLLHKKKQKPLKNLNQNNLYRMHAPQRNLKPKHHICNDHVRQGATVLVKGTVSLSGFLFLCLILSHTCSSDQSPTIPCKYLPPALLPRTCMQAMMSPRAMCVSMWVPEIHTVCIGGWRHPESTHY